MKQHHNGMVQHHNGMMQTDSANIATREVTTQTDYVPNHWYFGIKKYLFVIMQNIVFICAIGFPIIENVNLYQWHRDHKLS